MSLRITDYQRELFFGKRVICIADTPFQFLALLCIFSGLQQRECERCDLFVYPRSKQVEEIGMRIEQAGLFDSVMFAKRVLEPKEHMGASLMTESLFGSSRARQRLHDIAPELETAPPYDVVLCSFVDEITYLIKRFCAPDGYTVFFDDGSGSHNGNVFKSFFCLDDVLSHRSVRMGVSERAKSIFKPFARFIVGRRVSYNIKALCLFSPSAEEEQLYNDDIAIAQIGVPDDTAFLVDLVSPNLNAEVYSKSKAIYLTLSGTKNDPSLMQEVEAVRELAAALGDSLVIRPHPLCESNAFADLGVTVAPVCDIWELLLFTGAIREDMYLIAYGSSAQLHPKTLCDLEPSLIFLHKALSLGYSTSSIDQTVDELRRRYRDKSKVIVPVTMAECVKTIIIDS